MDSRQYLTVFETPRVGHVFTDVLVIGSGAAGLRAAIEASQRTHVIVVTKEAASLSATDWAQGGVAVVLSPSDTYESHYEDTMRVGCGLCESAAVRTLVEQGPARVDELEQWGAVFDLVNGKLAMTREGGHSAYRVVHARGDATGRELSTTLLRRVAEIDNIRLFERCFAIDLITHEGACVGAITHHPKYGHQIIWAKQTILASGGGGTVYRETTNPPVATGDGVAIAYRAGAAIRDIEMVQFHPTTLYVAGAARALISEAVRGEGAWLVDKNGERFMPAFHPDAELAPRDVVSRAIVSHIGRTRATCVFLDCRHFAPGKFAERFPHIDQLCRDFDLDATKDLIPVRPSAHYSVGGVATDLSCRTSVPGLLVCGEAANVGVHGANRLASNSLLEGLVYGAIAGQTALAELAAHPEPLKPVNVTSRIIRSKRTELDLSDVRNSLRSLMWRSAGIERHGDRLAEVIDITDFWGRYVMDKVFDDQFGWETQNMLTLAALISLAARHRTESRGVHFRKDYPETDDAHFAVHIDIRRVDDKPAIRETPVGG